MKSGYRPLGELIELVDVRNTDGSVQNLIGVSINKCFIKSVANTIGTDLSTYKIIERDDFAVSLMQVSRDEKIPIACLKEYDKAIMSPAYPIFRVKNREEVLPDYLDLWFKRSEFDREAAFIAVGGVRGSMPWEDFCRMQVRVPDLEEQKKIVHAYKVIEDRINLKKRINERLLSLCNTQFMKCFASCSEFQDEKGDWFSQPLEAYLKRVSMGPFGSNIKTDCFVKSGVPVLNGDNISGYLLSEKSFRYVDSEKASDLRNSIARSGDIVITHRGTLGQLALIPETTKFNEYVISQSQFVITCDLNHVFPEYLLFYFHTETGRRRLLANDNTTGVPSIARPTSYIKALHVPIPPISLQEKWVVFVRQCLSYIVESNIEIEKLEELAQTTLSRLSN